MYNNNSRVWTTWPLDAALTVKYLIFLNWRYNMYLCNHGENLRITLQRNQIKIK